MCRSVTVSATSIDKAHGSISPLQHSLALAHYVGFSSNKKLEIGNGIKAVWCERKMRERCVKS